MGGWGADTREGCVVGVCGGDTKEGCVGVIQTSTKILPLPRKNGLPHINPSQHRTAPKTDEQK